MLNASSKSKWQASLADGDKAGPRDEGHDWKLSGSASGWWIVYCDFLVIAAQQVVWYILWNAAALQCWMLRKTSLQSMFEHSMMLLSARFDYKLIYDALFGTGQ